MFASDGRNMLSDRTESPVRSISVNVLGGEAGVAVI
jgi:hypothetical protein